MAFSTFTEQSLGTMDEHELNRALELMARPIILELMKRGFTVSLGASLDLSASGEEREFFEVRKRVDGSAEVPSNPKSRSRLS